ncbi:hypothetical protein HDU76_010271, partial [Blyttiomyces sp. JEL0837]
MERRLKDAEDENKALREHLAILLNKMAKMEEDHAIKQGRMNEHHLAEMEITMKQHEDEVKHLQEERSQIIAQLDECHAEIDYLKEKLEGVAATAAFVTDMASSLEDLKDANETELEIFKRTSMRERKALMSQLDHYKTKSTDLDKKVSELQTELAKVKSDYSVVSLLVNDLKEENAEIREHLAASKKRNFSISSLLESDTSQINEDSHKLTD